MLQGDGDALHGELTPVLKSLLEKVNELGSLTARQAKSAIRGLRSSEPDKIRQFFNELAAMDLADVQGAGSRLTLTSKVLTTVDKVVANAQHHKQDQNLDNTGFLEKSNSKVLTTVDKVLTHHNEAETLISQEVQGINQPTVDVFDAVQNSDTETQPLNQESDTDAVEISVEESKISEKTSTPSTLAKSEPETLIQQDKKGADNLSTLLSTVENLSTLSSTKTNAGKKHRTFELGDRVVVKDVGGQYQGVRGVVTEVRHYSTHTGLMVKFDKEVAFMRQDEFIAGDLMYLAPGE
jgi:hypothetical protein